MTHPEPSDGKILLLDDEQLVTRSIEALLKMETLWHVAVFDRPADALGILGTLELDVVVVDFLMPEMDGIEFLRRVKEAEPFASRVLLTGYADKQNAIRSINEVGLYQYLEKPWDNDHLLLVLRNAIERARLLRRVDQLIRREEERDRSLDGLRARLLKAMV